MSEQQYDWAALLQAAGITPPSNPVSLRQAIAAIAAQGGTSVQGANVTHHAPFTFDTPNLLTGWTAVFTDGWQVAEGEYLVDAWVDIDTSWDGTTPTGDMGPFLGHATSGSQGAYRALLGQALSMAAQDLEQLGAQWPALLGGGQLSRLIDISSLVIGSSFYFGLYTVAATSVNLISDPTTSGGRFFPALFTSSDPLKFVVSQDGTSLTQAEANATDPPSLPLHVVTGVNDEFVFTPGGGGGAPTTFTVAPGTYTTLGAAEAAMGAAVNGSAQAFSTFVTPFTDPSYPTSISLRVLASTDLGTDGNGDSLSAGANDVSAGLGFTETEPFAGGNTATSPGSTVGAATLHVTTCT